MIVRQLLFAGQKAFLLLLAFRICNGSDAKTLCTPSSCGDLHNISYPFRLKSDPQKCGDQRYTLSCENNSTILYLYSGKYYVQEINYVNFTIRLRDAGVDKHDCLSYPSFPLTRNNFSIEDPYIWYRYKWVGSEFEPELSQMIIITKCANPVNSSVFVDTASCNDNENYYSYVNIGGMEASDLMSMCSIDMMAMLPADKEYKNMTFVEIHRELAYGFELSWHNSKCKACKSCYYAGNRDIVLCRSGYAEPENLCYLHFRIYCFSTYISVGIREVFYLIRASLPTLLIYFGLFTVMKTLCGTPIVFAFLIYKWRRRHFSGYEAIENFLQTQNNLMPVRYTYSEVKKMTRGFKEKLGEGGFGSVYKGKLRSGHVAAIKMLDKSKGNGQDFISEVGTIGRIYHTNIVKLIGFCVEGSKHALIYEFMANGSLDNYISHREGSVSLCWDKLYQVSLGVARGIQYLHQGCHMQILHFDIKPHNILLDENFIPKISDFGLAKLYTANGTIKSLTAVRGTIGYMAPELFYKNIGRVSHKADVYSFGMLLLEMAGKRANPNASGDNTSEAYFPFWVHDEVSSAKFAATGDSTENSNEIAKKMVVVGLWCIQMKPSDRPAMSQVIQMLEGDLESLPLPPRPNLYPQETKVEDNGNETSSLSAGLSESRNSTEYGA